MKKLVILSLIAPVAIGLAACQPTVSNTTVDLNVAGDDNAMMSSGNDMMSNDAMMSNDMAPKNAM